MPGHGWLDIINDNG